MNKDKCLIVDDIHPTLFDYLDGSGVGYNYLPDINRNAIAETINQYQGLVIRSKTQIDSHILDLATQLKWIARAGAGLDGIDTDYAIGKGIKLIHASEGNRTAVGEHTLGLLLAIMNKIAIGNEQVKSGIWNREENRGYEIHGKTVGIIGYGNAGSRFAKCLSGFDCKVLAYDKYNHHFAEGYAVYSTLEQLFDEVDILSLHIPLTTETKGWINFDFFSKFRKPIWFINAARGPIVPLSDLLKAIESNKVIAAGLDVLENEKIQLLTQSEQQVLNRLINTNKVVFTPHVAGWTVESYYKIGTILGQKIAKLYNTNL